jgi:hypothetical protein
MRSSPRARWPGVAAALTLELALVGLAVGSASAIGGCGRLGFDALAPTVPDAEGPPLAMDAPGAVETGSVETGSVDEASTEAAGPDADAACSTSAVVDYCSSIPPLPAPPIIDGVLDCGPALVPIIPEDWRSKDPLPPFPPGNSAAVAAAWRPDGLYVFLAVTTPVAIPAEPASPAYFGAGVELFVDDDGAFMTPPTYDNPGTIQFIVRSPPDVSSDASTDTCPDGSSDASTDAAADASPDASTTGSRADAYRNGGLVGPWTSTQFGTFPTPGGFVFEGFVVASDLGLTGWSLAAGGRVGFDVAIDVSFTTACMTGVEGHRAGQYFLHVSTPPPDAAADAAAVLEPYQDVGSFCTPTLTSM